MLLGLFANKRLLQNNMKIEIAFSLLSYTVSQKTTLMLQAISSTHINRF